MSTDDVTQDLTVGAVASLTGVSARTLHHWDAVGLVSPSGRSRSGYRLYPADDITGLHRVLVHRETGMPLARIAGALGHHRRHGLVLAPAGPDRRGPGPHRARTRFVGARL